MPLIRAALDDVDHLRDRELELAVRVEEMWTEPKTDVRPVVAEDLARQPVAPLSPSGLCRLLVIR